MTVKTLPLLLLTGAVAVAAGASTSYFLAAAGPAPEGPRTDTAAALERLSEQVARLADRQQGLETSLARVQQGSELVAPSGGRVSQGDIESAVARWMQANGAPEPVPAAAVDVPAPAEERVAAAMERLAHEDLSSIEVQALWRELAAEGLTDDLVAAYEALAEAAPNDPDAQVAVAGAYLNKIVEVGNSPEAGLWATRADGALDRALEIDERHWEARFTKAVSLSFWPPVFGKQGEAIQQFEILVGQQASMPPDASHAQTHLLLGNMYRQIGEQEQAAAAWQQGLDLYPDSEELLSQLEVYSGTE